MLYDDELAAIVHQTLANRYGNPDAENAAIVYDVCGNVCAYAKRFMDGRVDVVNVNKDLYMTSSRRICNSTSMFAALVKEFGQGYRYVYA